MSQTFLFATWSLSLQSHYFGISSHLAPWMLLLHCLLLSKIWGDAGCWFSTVFFFFSLSTLSCLSVCVLLNYWFSRLCEPCLELQDATPHELVTNVLLSLAYFSRVLKKRAAFAYPHNFTQYSVWHMGFFIRFIKADIFPMDKKILLVIPLCPHSLVHTQLCQCFITWVIQL